MDTETLERRNKTTTTKRNAENNGKEGSEKK